jgi:hypothetical protein
MSRMPRRRAFAAVAVCWFLAAGTSGCVRSVAATDPHAGPTHEVVLPLPLPAMPSLPSGPTKSPDGEGSDESICGIAVKAYEAVQGGRGRTAIEGHIDALRRSYLERRRFDLLSYWAWQVSVAWNRSNGMRQYRGTDKVGFLEPVATALNSLISICGRQGPARRFGR